MHAHHSQAIDETLTPAWHMMLTHYISASGTPMEFKHAQNLYGPDGLPETYMRAPAFAALTKGDPVHFNRFRPVMYIGDVFFKKSLRTLSLPEKSALCEAAIAACVDYADKGSKASTWSATLGKHSRGLSSQARGTFGTRGALVTKKRISLTVSHVSELGVSLRKFTARMSAPPMARDPISGISMLQPGAGEYAKYFGYVVRDTSDTGEQSRRLRIFQRLRAAPKPALVDHDEEHAAEVAAKVAEEGGDDVDESRRTTSMAPDDAIGDALQRCFKERNTKVDAIKQKIKYNQALSAEKKNDALGESSAGPDPKHPYSAAFVETPDDVHKLKYFGAPAFAEDDDDDDDGQGGWGSSTGGVRFPPTICYMHPPGSFREEDDMFSDQLENLLTTVVGDWANQNAGWGWDEKVVDALKQDAEQMYSEKIDEWEDVIKTTESAVTSPTKIDWSGPQGSISQAIAEEAARDSGNFEDKAAAAVPTMASLDGAAGAEAPKGPSAGDNVVSHKVGGLISRIQDATEIFDEDLPGFDQEDGGGGAAGFSANGLPVEDFLFGFDEGIGGDFGFGKRTFTLRGSAANDGESVVDQHAGGEYITVDGGYVAASASKGWPSLEAAAFKPSQLDTIQGQIAVGKVPQLQNVSIKKQRKQVGIKAVEGHNGVGIFIMETVPGSPARMCLGLRPGTSILTINGQDVTAMSKAESVAILKSAKMNIDLAIRYDPVNYARAVTKANAAKPIVAPNSAPTKVSLHRGLKGSTLGVRLVSADTGKGVYLAGVIPGSPAWDAQKDLRAGMMFLVVNKKVDVRNYSKIELAQVLAQCGMKVELQLRYDPVGFARALAHERVATSVPVQRALAEANAPVDANGNPIVAISAADRKKEKKEKKKKDKTLTKEKKKNKKKGGGSDAGGESSEAPPAVADPSAADPAVLVVQLDRPDPSEAIGMGLVGITGESGVFVTSVSPKGLACSSEEIKPGLRLLKVDGNDCNGLDKAACIEIMKANQGPKVDFEFKYDPTTYAVVLAAEDPGKEQKVKSITIEREEGASLGIKLLPHASGPGVYIAGVNPGTAAHASKKLRAGFLIMEIDGTDTSKMKKKHLMAALKETGTVVAFSVKYDPVGFAQSLAKAEAKLAKGAGKPAPEAAAAAADAAAPVTAAEPEPEAPPVPSGPRPLDPTPLSRADAGSAMIAHGTVGGYAVRATNATSGGYALTVLLAPGRLTHVSIVKNEKGEFLLPGSKHAFASVQELVTRHETEIVDVLPLAIQLVPNGELIPQEQKVHVRKADGPEQVEVVALPEAARNEIAALFDGDGDKSETKLSQPTRAALRVVLLKGPATVQKVVEAAGLMVYFDTDGDGALSLAETLEHMDHNDDGRITVKEFLSAGHAAVTGGPAPLKTGKRDAAAVAAAKAGNAIPPFAVVRLTLKRADTAESIGIKMLEGAGGTGTFVHDMKPGSCSDKHKEMKIGLRFTHINRVAVGPGKDSVVAAIKTSSENIDVTFEYDPAAFAVAVAALPAPEKLKGVKASIEWPKGQKLGMKMIEAENGKGVFCNGVAKKSLAATVKKLKRGVLLQTINDKDVSKYSKKKLSKLLKKCAGSTMEFTGVVQEVDYVKALAAEEKKVQDEIRANAAAAAAAAVTATETGTATADASAPPPVPQRAAKAEAKLSWLHDNFPQGQTKPMSEAKLKAAGLDDGRFLVSSREGKPGQYVLAVVFRGKPTHHQITTNGDGKLVVNKKTFGDSTTIEDLVKALGKKQPGWPVPLDKPVLSPVPGDAPAGDAAAPAPVAKPTAPVATRWLYPATFGRPEVEAKIVAAGQDDGRFLVRHRPNAGEYVLSVVFRGKPTHHQIVTNDEGQLIVNKKAFGNSTTIEQLVKALGKKQPGWPVPLDKPILQAAAPPVQAEKEAPAPENPPAVPARKTPAAPATATPAPTTAPAPAPEPAPAPAEEDAAEKAAPAPAGTSWLYPATLGREEAEAKIVAAGQDDGRFLVRHRPNAGEYVLSVVFRGKPTHHQIVTNDEGQLIVNKKAFGNSTTIEQLVKALGKKQPGWPVGLDKPVGGDGAYVDVKPAASPPKKKKAAVAASSGSGSAAWLVGDISREESEAKLTAAGGDDGCFVVRTRPGKPGHYVIAVIFKGKPTHHMVAPNESGTLTANKKAFGDHTTIEALIAQLGKKQPGWPVPLNKPAGGAGAGAGAGAPATPKQASAGSSGDASWLHSYSAAFGRPQVESKLTKAGLDDGRFLVRSREAKGEYVLSVVFRGNPTHHLIKTGPDGKLVVNKKTFGDSTSIEQLVETLSSKQPGWPIPLDKPVSA